MAKKSNKPKSGFSGFFDKPVSELTEIDNTDKAKAFMKQYKDNLKAKGYNIKE